MSRSVVVVIGGAGLLGRAFCEAVAASGAALIVADKDDDAGMRVADAIREAGGSAEFRNVDISSRESVDSLIESVSNTHGRIDAVVNTAYPRTPQYGRAVEAVDYLDFCENVNLHLGGYFLVAQRFAVHFSTLGTGNIINLASVYGIIAPRFDLYAGTAMTMPVEYAAIKAGVVALTRYFAAYYRQAGIRCNALAPGGVFDGQPEVFVARYGNYCGTRGMLRPDDLTGALLFLLSDASRYMTGQVLVVDDGFSL